MAGLFVFHVILGGKVGKRAWWSFLLYLLVAASAVDAAADELVKGLRRDVQESKDILAGASAKLQAGSAPGSEIAGLKAAAEKIRASHLLMEERFRSSGERAAVLGGKAIERQNRVVDGYRKAVEAYLALIDALPADGTADAATIDSLKTLLETIAPKKKRPLLGSLPYKHLAYPSREPATEPNIVPAYRGGNRTVTPADTAGSSEAPLSKEIVELAQSLQWNPVLIYEWVKNNVETEWYFGVMKGAEETLRQKSGNDADQAALLVSLLRASGFPSRYVKGTIEFFPGIDKVKNLIGIEDPMKIAAFFQKAGIPFKPVIAGGTIANFQVEHIWVESQIPYSNYRGAVIDDMGKSWLGLDTSIKPPGLVWNAPLEIPGFSLDGLRDDYLQAVQTVTPLEFVKARAEEYLALNNPGKSWQDLLQSKTIIPDVLNIIPASLQFRQVAITGEYQTLPDDLRHKLIVSAINNVSELFSLTLETFKLSNKRVVITYEPETVEDQNIIDSFGGLDNTPPYLVRLRPVLTVDDERVVVARDGLPMGANYTLAIEVISPNGTELINNTHIAGSLAAIGIVAQKATAVTAIFESDGAADILFKEAIGYIDRWNRTEEELTAFHRVAISRPVPTVVTVGGVIDVTYLMDIPHGFEWKGVFIDAALRGVEVVGDPTQEKAFMRLSALQGSILENRIFEDNLQTDSISTAKCLQLARIGGIPIHNIDRSNIATLLPQLPADYDIRTDITNAVNQNLVVTIPWAELTYRDWSGIGYVKENTATGESGWMLSGSIAGGMTAVSGSAWSRWQLARTLAFQFTDNPATATLGITISSPEDGATITGPYSNVTGTINNFIGVETGVMVNGVPATVHGRRFFANHVQLQEGNNTITVTATDTNGQATTATRTITAKPGHYLRIVPNIESGTAPLDISIRLDGSFSIINPSVSITGPVPMSLTQGESPREFSVRLTVEGTYTITAKAGGPDQLVYGDSVKIIVISKAQLEAMLRDKWEDLKAKLLAKDVEGAVAHLISSIRDDYRTGFSAYIDKLPLLAQDLPPIELVYASESRAKARLFREETVKGQRMIIGYPVYYIREDGIWKLANF